MTKKLFFILSFLMICSVSYAQLVITPYAVFIDSKNKFGTYTVFNETEEAKEVTISFKFAYPVSDSAGNITMLYDSSDNSYSAANFIKAFPRKFTLDPKGKQIVRMTINPPAGLNDGTYWARIVTTSSSLKLVTDSTTGISATINFFYNQVTTAIYKNNRYENKVDYKDLTVNIDTTGVNFLAGLSVTGDQPFFSRMEYKIFDSGGNIILDDFELVTIYFDMLKKFSFGQDQFKSGNYTAEFTLSAEQSSDVPESGKGLKQPITKKVEFIIP